MTEVPEAADLVAEHIAYWDGDVLPHLLLPDVLRFCVGEFTGGRSDVSNRVLAAVEYGLQNGDDALVNAVTVSFVEHVGAEPGETADFLATWPACLDAVRRRLESGE